jgi:hypothetical protein
VNDVGARSSLLDTPYLIVLEGSLEDLVELQLGALAMLVGGTLLELPLHVLQLTF